MRARPGDLGPGPAAARRAASDSRCRSGSLIIEWRLCNSRPATIFSSGYTHLSCLYNSRRTIQFSCGITTILGRLYNVGPAIPCSTGHAILYRLFANIYRRASVPRARVPRANAPSASVDRVNAWNICVRYISPPTGHLKLHMNYIYRSSKLHTNYIYQPGKYM